MNQLTTCPQCESVIDGDSPMGICPNCLLKMGFDSQDVQTSEYQGRFVPPTPAELAPLFPELEILELIGKGGMGVVYRAKQRDLDRVVALKILRPDFGEDPSFAERFLREGRALAQLNHPNIITVHNFGHREHLYFLLMEYVDGADLRHLQQASKLSAAETLALVPPICEALQYAHEQGVIHRDIKPENILLTQSGRIKIADFGLAKLAGIEEAFGLTGTHQVMGTPHYMAPEQYERPQDVDHRADIYSLGVVIYELLTGELPLGRFSLPSDSDGLDVRLDDVVIRSLEKKPERRFQRASEFQTAVEELSSAAPSVPPIQADADENWVSDFVDRIKAINWRNVAEQGATSVKSTAVKVVANRREIVARTKIASSRCWGFLQTLYVGRVVAGLAIWSIIVAVSIIIGLATLAQPYIHIADHSANRVVSLNESFDSMRVVITRDAIIPQFVVLPSTEFVSTTTLEISGPKVDEISPLVVLRVVFDGNRREAQIRTTGRTASLVPWTPTVVRTSLSAAGVDVDAPHSQAEQDAIWDFVNAVNTQSSGVDKLGDVAYRGRGDELIDDQLFMVLDEGFGRRHHGFGVDEEIIVCLASVTWSHGALIFLALPFCFWWYRSRESAKPAENEARTHRLVTLPLRLLSLSSLLGATLLLGIAWLLWQFDLGAERQITTQVLVSGAITIAGIGFIIGLTCHYLGDPRHSMGRMIGAGCATVSLLVPVLNLLTFSYAFWTLLSLRAANSHAADVAEISA